ncbi:MAG: BACON domain-containing protein [Bacteroidales bacterium]|nr:BACON domain-containing protein [Bacteroidales bacterium]
MKKLLFFLCLAAGLVSCTKETSSLDDTPAAVPLTFKISVAENESSDTRALKSGWKNNDVIYVFFKGLGTKYLTLTYGKKTWDESTFSYIYTPGWEVASHQGVLMDTDISGLTDHTLTAVYFPEPVDVYYADNQFSFFKDGSPVYNYYLQQTGKSYTVEGSTVSASLTMQKPVNFVQFHIPGTTSEVAQYSLSCPLIQPVACMSVSTDGSIIEDIRQEGTGLKGIADEDGGIFSGRLVNPSATEYSFSLEDDYYIYTLTRNSALTSGRMYNFPVLTDSRWGKVSRWEFTTVAGLKDLLTGQQHRFTGRLTNAVVSFVPSTVDAIIKDDTGSILYHKETGIFLSQGQTISGKVTVDGMVSNSIKQISSLSASFSGNVGTVEPEVVTLAQLAANYAKYESAYVKVEGVTSRTTTVTKGNIRGRQDGTDYIIYTNVAVPINAGDVFTAEGTVTIHDSDRVLMVWRPPFLTITNPIPVLSASPVSTEVKASTSSVTWSIASNTDWTISPGAGVTPSTASGNGNAEVTLYFAANESSDAATYTATVSAAGCEDVTITITQLGSGSSSTITDVITSEYLTAYNTTYADFSDVSITSAARYAGNSAKDSSGNIQLRSKNSNSGIVSTTSGGKVKSVTITREFGSPTVDVYCKNTAYTSATELYGDSCGIKVGSLTEDNPTLDLSALEDEYAYVGLRSQDGNAYLSSIKIEWE